MTTQESTLVGKQVFGTDGEEIGTVSQIVHAEGSGEAEWLVIRSGLFGMRERIAPYAGARDAGDKIYVPLNRDSVRDSPHVSLDDGLTSEGEEQLVRHYGRGPHGALTEGTGTTAGASVAGAAGAAATPRATATGEATARTAPKGEATARSFAASGTQARQPAAAGNGQAQRRDEAQAAGRQMPERGAAQAARQGQAGDEVEMVRFEQRLSVAKEAEEAGRARMRKVVETEEYEETVACLSDDFEIVKEEIKDGRVEQRELAQDEQELVLYRERLIVTKVAVPVERIMLRRKRGETQQTVRETVAKERIEVEKSEVPVQPSAKQAATARKQQETGPAAAR